MAAEASFRLREVAAGVAPRTSNGPKAGAWIVRVWLIGVALVLGILVLGLVRLLRLARHSTPVTSGPWASLAGEIARSHGLRRPVRVLQSEHPTLLVTWGLARATVVLPAPARGWPRDRARVVLAHELAHAARRDWPVQLLAECLRAVYWFNPIAWIACRRLRHESELACDDAVLRTGTNGCDYASHLLDLARILAGRPAGLPAPGMARPSGLQRRVRAMVNAHLDHGAATVRARLATLLIIVAVTIPVLSARTAGTGAGQPDQISGQVLDQMHRPIEGVRIAATRRSDDETREVHTDAEGRYTLSGLPAGEYGVVVSRPGFKSHRVEVVLDGLRPGSTDVTLEVGSLFEAVTIRGITPLIERPGTYVGGPRPGARRTVQCVSQPGGGHVVAPAKLVHVVPTYPSHLIGERVGGNVILEGVVSTTGTVQSLTVLRDAHPDLAAAAIEAVRQWQYTPTLLNCEPIDVVVTVTMIFSIGP